MWVAGTQVVSYHLLPPTEMELEQTGAGHTHTHTHEPRHSNMEFGHPKWPLNRYAKHPLLESGFLALLCSVSVKESIFPHSLLFPNVPSTWMDSQGPTSI